MNEPLHQDEHTSLYRDTIESYQDGGVILYTLVESEFPRVICTATVKPHAQGGPYLMWIETSRTFKRKGYATMMLGHLMERHPRLQVSAGSADGATWLAGLTIDR